MTGSETNPGRPNVLFFLTDDQRFDTIHALGNPDIITPNLDELVRRGTAFTRAYIMGGTTEAVCMPSRAMLMSGRTLFHIKGEGETIPKEHTTLPEHLRRHGYATFATGKWHNGPNAFTRSFSDGAQIFFGGMSDHFSVPLRDFNASGAYADDAVHYEEKKHSSDVFAEAAIEFLRTRSAQDAPFFLYLSFTAPHDPRDTHQMYHDLYDVEKIPLPENFLPEHPFDNGELRVRDERLAAWPRQPQEIQRHIAEYYAMITHIDARIGNVLDALRETGQADNTIIVFAGDNGLALGRHGLMGKQNLYDHSLHVPLILSGPGIPRGEKRETYCYLLDIFPTLCDLLGVDTPDSVEGRSLAPALRDAAARVRGTLLFAYRNLQRATQDERFKIIEYVVQRHTKIRDEIRHSVEYDDKSERTIQLFDLKNDPLEMHDLSKKTQYVEKVDALRKQLYRWRKELDDTGDSFWQ